MTQSPEKNEGQGEEFLPGTEAFTRSCASAKKELELLCDLVNRMPTGKDADTIKKHLDSLSKTMGKLSC